MAYTPTVYQANHYWQMDRFREQNAASEARSAEFDTILEQIKEFTKLKGMIDRELQDRARAVEAFQALQVKVCSFKLMTSAMVHYARRIQEMKDEAAGSDSTQSS